MSVEGPGDRKSGIILHICPLAEWRSAQAYGWYRSSSLESEGFIHCSEPDQLIEVADYLFRGRSGLILLLIDPARVVAEIRSEDAGNGKFYPHIYGALNESAVIGTLPFEPDPEGRFALPQEISAPSAS
jgi:uncharacterized protein (DUF952 family)